MQEITMNELLALLKNYHPAVHCESYLLYKLNYRSRGSSVRCYLIHGCAVFCSSFDHRGTHGIECCIHEISGDCDWLAAYNRCEAMTAAEMLKYERCERQISLCHCGELPDALAGFPGTYRFTRTAEDGTPDPHICVLTKKDYAGIRALCDPSKLSGDTWFGQSEANTFYRCFNNWEYSDGYVKLLGYRDDGGRLLGIASYGTENDFTLCCVLRDIFVSPEGRGKGVGKALVRAALANAPGREWLYQADIGNKASAALAESLGFTLEGAKLEVTI